MKLAVCLLTADRSEYTCRTLESYINTNYNLTSLLLHADDGSENDSNTRAAEAAGFLTVYRARVRSGPVAACRALWHYAIASGASHILHLENDWVFDRVIPQSVLGISDTYDCMRLYGEFKAQAGDRMPCGPHIMGTKERIAWSPAVFGSWERTAAAHWGGPPSITRSDLMLHAIQSATTFKELSTRMLRLRTIRPLRNVVWHIGEERTPGAKFNA